MLRAAAEELVLEYLLCQYFPDNCTHECPSLLFVEEQVVPPVYTRWSTRANTVDQLDGIMLQHLEEPWGHHTRWVSGIFSKFHFSTKVLLCEAFYLVHNLPNPITYFGIAACVLWFGEFGKDLALVV